MANTYSIDLELSSSQYLSVANGPQITTDFTIEAWIKPETLVTGYIVGKFGNSGNRGGYNFELLNSGKIRVLWQDSSGNNSYCDTDNAVITAGTWYHVAVAVDVSAVSATIYVNGSSVACTMISTSATSIGDTSSIMAIGRLGQFNQNYFDGLIDEVIIWSDIRTGTEISESYNSGNGKIYNGDEAGMEAYWRLENDLLDETSNNHDLTNNNSATFSTDVPFSGGTAYTQEIEEVLSLDDTVSTLITSKKMNESVSLTDIITNSASRFFSESITLVDTTSNAVVTVKEFTESVTINDVFSIKQTGKAIGEVVTVVDTINTQIIINKVIDEAVTLVDTITAGKYFTRTLSETISIVDTISKLLVAGILLTERISIVDRLFGLLNGINMKYNRKYDENADDYVDKYNDV